jgi:hypothetical protein
MAAQFWCLHCTAPRWQAGGLASLGRHLRVHGIDEPFPRTIHVDSDGYEVTWEGAPVMERVGRTNRRRRAYTEGLDGWMRSVAAKTHLDGKGPNQ